MIRLPATIKIGGVRWIVRGRRRLPGKFGETRIREAEILIWTGCPLGQQQDTLVHELLHACLSNVPHGLDDDGEESIVSALAPWLLAALRDNPALVAYLTGG